jgi:hypothetical protein
LIRSGKISMNIDVEGRGLLKISKYGIRDVTKIDFNNYTNNIVVNGNFKAPNYKGEISINDPN